MGGQTAPCPALPQHLALLPRTVAPGCNRAATTPAVPVEHAGDAAGEGTGESKGGLANARQRFHGRPPLIASARASPARSPAPVPGTSVHRGVDDMFSGGPHSSQPLGWQGHTHRGEEMESYTTHGGSWLQSHARRHLALPRARGPRNGQKRGRPACAGRRRAARGGHGASALPSATRGLTAHIAPDPGLTEA